MQTLSCEHLVTGVGDEVLDGASVLLDGDRIVAVQAGVTPGAERVDGWVVPGFVDTHCHGAAGADFASPDPVEVTRAVEFHRSHGTTTQFVSTVTEEWGETLAQIRRLRGLIAVGQARAIHLEGPFLAKARRGAHNAGLLLDPELGLVHEMIAAGRGDVAMVTLAPELSGGLEAIAELRKFGVVAALGHSEADEDVTRQAVDAGVQVATHLFNAMRPIHHRVPGPVPELLTDARVAVELICDGVHLHPDVVRMAIQAAGVDRTMLITDAMSATGQPDGDYMLGSLPVVVTEGIARLATQDGSQGAIAGSTLTMDRAVQFVVQKVGLELPRAVLMASRTPAKVHRLDEVGTIASGKLADLCVLDDDAALRRVLWRGRWLAS